MTKDDDHFKAVIKGICKVNNISPRKPRFETIENLVVISVKNHYKDGVDPDCFMILNYIYQLLGPFGVKFSQQLFLFPNSKRVAKITLTFKKEDYDDLNWQLVNGRESNDIEG